MCLRVPVSEANGRIETSTATVLVIPEIEHIDIKINPADLQVDSIHSSGTGGQNVNKTESLVRITYILSEIVVSCQVERDQIANFGVFNSFFCVNHKDDFISCKFFPFSISKKM